MTDEEIRLMIINIFVEGGTISLKELRDATLEKAPKVPILHILDTLDDLRASSKIQDAGNGKFRLTSGAKKTEKQREQEDERQVSLRNKTTRHHNKRR